MRSQEYYDCCPKCGTTKFSLIDREYVITTNIYRQISCTMLRETITCDECGETWFDNYKFLHGNRGDWMFASPILKCPICGGDSFEMERCGRGTKEGQFLSFRCIDNDEFIWGEVYSFSHVDIPENSSSEVE